MPSRPTDSPDVTDRVSPGALRFRERKPPSLQRHRMRVSPLNTPDFGPPATVALLNFAPLLKLTPHLGLIVFTLLTAAIGLYLIYTMLRPDAF